MGVEQKSVELYGLGQREKNDAETPLLANWIQHPEQQTVDAVRQAYAQGQLSDGSYRTALSQAMRLQGSDTGSTDPEKVQQATLDNNRVNH